MGLFRETGRVVWVVPASGTNAAPGPVRYVEIQAQVQREMAGLDAELGGL